MSTYPSIEEGIIELLFDNGAVNHDSPPVEAQVKAILEQVLKTVHHRSLDLAEDFLFKLKQNSPNLWQEFLTGEYVLGLTEGELAADGVMNYVFEIM